MFDIGVNLTSSQFSKDHPQVIARAKDAGVTGMLITGTDAEVSQMALDLATENPGYCWSTAGVHPHQASTWQTNIEQQISALATNASVVAIGECGLDFNRNFSTPAEQEIAFTAQLALAAELSLPVFLHCRDAHERFIALLSPWLDKIPAAIVHCFTGTANELDSCLSLGLSIGITGWVCDERRGLELRALLPRIPAQYLLLETDAPYLLPRDIHPKPASRRNEPCFLPHIVQQVAVWRQEDPQWLGQKTDENARRIFRLV
ncbi:3'-5' ssDNA/RNA exonuclease TatD [Yersinia frederiksenii]|uniref:3'-5' ssDNA/RNA exonuclease TatD n=1 Tax=Yersinia frederiksenii TaxID=29484 RepID=UPI0005E94CC7|nr:3'-5' ssDNA/RNA exonuclease TatD [Yersinia frederiksenii]CNL79504.1 DNase TatD [Yersinia frederiksenii]CQH56308.1 DNase TatD [Yersinia frederiksenii]HEC1650217.1 3'-5' ssDNA/RNA exonuclease TatD [Yersinia enterocolitica]